MSVSYAGSGGLRQRAAGDASPEHLEGLKQFLKREIEGSPVLASLKQKVADASSTAGRVEENVFTREFLCPKIASYFYTEVRSTLGLDDEEEIRKGLGAEGHRHCEGFGFTPNGKKHLFLKTDVIKSAPPKGWRTNDTAPLTGKCPWPDFAIRHPLPLSVVGEVKFVKRGKTPAAVQHIYDAARQAVFYLGAFRGGYRDALIVLADATPERVVSEALATLRPELRGRFGPVTGIYLLVLSLS
jgi:hypothetical protein